ncbi:MAG: hypothetical protein P9M00_04335 [Candidatus Tritonobacter lacicola]|nr:hypothetical protein [Candidatus Tritonobacter lacicola]
MRETIKTLDKRNPSTSGEWKEYFHRLAKTAGFTEIIEEAGHGEVFVKEHPSKIDGNLGKLVVGKDFILQHEDVFRNHPSIFKSYLEHTVIHLAGEVMTAGIVYSGMEGLATMVGAEKLGYSQKEILELLAMEILMGYIASKTRQYQNYEDYLKKAESVYDVIFWDFLTKEEVVHIIYRAREIKGELSESETDRFVDRSITQKKK